MQNFEYDINISASTEAEADVKMKALIILAAKLKANELTKLAHIVEKDPVTLAIAKKAMKL